MIGIYTAKQEFVFHWPSGTSTVPKGATVRVTQVNDKTRQALLAVGERTEWFSYSCIEQWLEPQQ